MQEKCIERNITITDDEIVDVKLKEDGSIKEVLSKDNTYNADFYIDCTGFKKLLIKRFEYTKNISRFARSKNKVVYANNWTTCKERQVECFKKK